jgi:hypothetical protein
MINLKFDLNKELILAAYGFEQLRNNCKIFLSNHNMNFDKFTVVSHDAFIGFISEVAVKNFVVQRYADKGIQIIPWHEKFDIKKIKKIIESDSPSEENIQLVKEYFYDKYDLEIKKGEKSLYVDIKTALTMKDPSIKWNFLYPVVQAKKAGKDYMILTYYVTNSPELDDLNKIVLVGFISEEVIRKCKIIKKGSRTKFGTVSNIDNYETELSIHYKDIDLIINSLFQEVEN